MALELTLEVEPSEKTMRYYCTLDVRSNSDQSAANIFKQDARAFLSFEDLHARSNVRRRPQTFAGNASIQFVERNDLPRYEWILESKVEVDYLDPDPYVHVKWLLSHLKRGTSLADIQKQGVECTLSFIGADKERAADL